MFDQQRIGALPIHQSAPARGAPVLSGLRVIDFTHFVAGPLATQTLADFGADVIKIEAPGRGDDFRHYPTVDPAMPAQGGPFLWANRNKKSLALDMKSEAGLKVAKELIAQADVLVENFSSGVMERFGLDYATCASLNPRLVYCSISAYGREGPYADRLGFDPIAQAESGFISMNGYDDRQGVRSGAAVMDIATAMSATNGILLALMARARDGVGQKVEVALFDTAILMTGFGAMQHLTTGYEPRRNGNVSPDTCPSGVFMSQDKPVSGQPSHLDQPMDSGQHGVHLCLRWTPCKSRVRRGGATPLNSRPGCLLRATSPALRWQPLRAPTTSTPTSCTSGAVAWRRWRRGSICRAFAGWPAK